MEGLSQNSQSKLARLRFAVWAPCIVLLLILAIMTGASPSPAQERPDPQIRIASLIRDLGAESYERRTAAGASLQQVLPDARKQLLQAAKSRDPEIRLRAQSLLHSLEVEDVWRAGHVKLEKSSGLASDMVLAIAEQTGNKIALGDNYDSFNDVNVKLSQEGDVWPLLDSLCRQSRNRVRPHYGTSRSGLVLVNRPLGNYPVAYSGPIRTQIITAQRIFREDLDYEKSKSEISHTFQFKLLMSWEDRFQLVAYRPNLELLQAVTDTGAVVRLERSDDPDWHVADRGDRNMATLLHLQPPAANAAKLKRLQLGWDLIAIGQPERLVVGQLDSSKPHRQDDLAIIVNKVEHLSGPRWQINLSIARELPVPEAKEVLFRENRFELIDQGGVVMRQQGRPKGNVQGHTANMEIEFVGETDNSKPTRLIVHYPRIRDRRRVLIEFENVPLPVAQIE